MPPARRRIVTAWAVLCLSGLAATSVLTSEPYTETLEFPAEEPTPTGTHAVDCQELADYVEDALDPSPPPGYGGSFAVDVAVPQECADELAERGLPRPRPHD
ncbi:hypothetical protein ACWDV7_01490 [Streptomyces sp. NPDC003362]